MKKSMDDAAKRAAPGAIRHRLAAAGIAMTLGLVPPAALAFGAALAFPARALAQGAPAAPAPTLPPAPAPAAPVQPPKPQSYGEWEQRCETPPGASAPQCAIVQNVAAEDKPNITLVVLVLKTADGKSRLLRVVAPLGVLLPAGLGLKIDQTDVGRAGFVRCVGTGCIADVVMDDNLVTQFKNGQTATFIVFQTPEEGVGIPVKLSGFQQGLESLP